MFFKTTKLPSGRLPAKRTFKNIQPEAGLHLMNVSNIEKQIAGLR